nr:hypothetical protein [Cellvibrio zantedeschiae]
MTSIVDKHPGCARDLRLFSFRHAGALLANAGEIFLRCFEFCQGFRVYFNAHAPTLASLFIVGKRAAVGFIAERA